MPEQRATYRASKSESDVEKILKTRLIAMALSNRDLRVQNEALRRENAALRRKAMPLGERARQS